MTLLLSIEIIIPTTLLAYCIYRLLKLDFFKLKPNILIAFSPLLLITGIYLWLKNGLILDYGTEIDIETNYAIAIYFLGIANIFTGLFVMLLSFGNFLWSKINKTSA
jgi:hypothetical protein